MLPGIVEKPDCTLFYSCGNKDHTNGQWISSFWKNDALNLRICILRMRGKFLNYSIVNGHAPTETSDVEEKDGFFDALETAYDISPRNNIKIVLSNLNA